MNLRRGNICPKCFTAKVIRYSNNFVDFHVWLQLPSFEIIFLASFLLIWKIYELIGEVVCASVVYSSAHLLFTRLHICYLFVCASVVYSSVHLLLTRLRICQSVVCASVYSSAHMLFTGFYSVTRKNQRLIIFSI